MSEQTPLPKENYYITSGPQRSSITIELHTHIATRTWTGRLADPEKISTPLSECRAFSAF